MTEALVTGAGGALGQEVVRRLLGAGWSVLGIDAHERGLEPLSALPGAERLRCRTVDLTSASAVDSLFGELGHDADGHGSGLRIAHLVGGFAWAPITETTEGLLERMLTLNLRTTFNVMRGAAAGFSRAGAGALVAVSSPHALHSPAGVGAYAAAKSAVLRLVEALDAELAQGQGRARINAVLPGTMDTPENRRSMPDADPATWVSRRHVAEVVWFLLDDTSAGIRGAGIPVTASQGTVR